MARGRPGEGGAASHLDHDVVLGLLTAHARSVLVREGALDASTRFEEDLRADSLDLVEIIEGVERDLNARGVDLDLPDDTLLAVRTLGDAADAVLAHARTNKVRGGGVR
ncbi:MAG: phosphopantetheine-binding protein [Egibacteraceae bacterium]